MASSIIKIDDTLMEDDNMIVDDSKINNTVKLSKEHFSNTKQDYQSLKFNGFGLAGIENIKKLFDIIILLVCFQKENLLPRCKYGKRN